MTRWVGWKEQGARVQHGAGLAGDARACGCQRSSAERRQLHASYPRNPPLQAIAAWRDNSDWGRCQLVKSYLLAAGGFDEPQVVRQVELGGAQGPLQRLQAWAEGALGWGAWGGGPDPFFAVVARKL